MPLRSSHDDLGDLAQGEPELIDDSLSLATGLRLLRPLGAGGMAAVFLAERAPGRPASMLHPQTPARLAIKFMQASTARELQRSGIDPYKLFARESVALARLSDRQPPTQFVVAFYGCGLSEVTTRDGVRSLPWLAMEHVDGGTAGATLTDRVERAGRGVDPLRVLRLVRGIVQGLAAIHDEKMLHRDLKPDNVLTAGPIDDEVPKLADYGIARVEGLETGVPGATLAYAGFEQLVPSGGARNPLVGTWSDVHALSCLVWFIVGGEQWYRDGSWFAGERRSLRTAGRLHPGFVGDVSLLDALDDVLRRGAAPRLPRGVVDRPEAASLHALVSARYPSMTKGHERFADVDTFASALAPILEAIAEAQVARAARDQVAITSCRPTLTLVSGSESDAPYEAHERAPLTPHPVDPRGDATLELHPGRVAFQPDGKVLAASRDRLFFYVDDQPYAVVPPTLARTGDADLAACRWIVHLGELGYSLVSNAAVLFVRGGRWSVMPTPAAQLAGQRTVGSIQAAACTRGQLCVVTSETDDGEGGPELWRTSDGVRWVGPIAVPLGGDVHALADGAFGTLLVGGRGSKKGRAAFLSPDGSTIVYTSGVANGPPVRLALTGADRTAWGVSESSILRFDRNAADREHVDFVGAPVQLALDLVGIPWLVTTRQVLRRASSPGATQWRVVHQRTDSAADLAAIGFTPDGARLLDTRGGSLRLLPPDLPRWQAPV